MRLIIAVFALWAAASSAFAADGDHYPSQQPVKIVVPLTPGTTIDILARVFADKLSAKLHGTFVVLNRAGAGGLIAAQTVAAAPGDGYTLLFANSGHAILGTLNKNLPFDPVADFKGVTMVGEAPSVVVVSPSVGAHNLQDFVALLKKNPGKLNYGSAGIGTATHLAGAYFGYVTGAEMQHVPYKDSSQILSDMVAGRMQAVFAPAAYVQAMVTSGKLDALAVGDKEPMKTPFPTPTALSLGVNYVNTTWYGFLASATVPAPILKTLNEAIVEISQEPDVQARIKQVGIEPRRVGLADFDAYIASDMKRLAPLLEKIGNESSQ